MKQLTVFLLVLAVAAGAYAAPTGKAKASRAGKSSSASAAAPAAGSRTSSDSSTALKGCHVQFGKARINLGGNTLATAPRLEGKSSIGRVRTGKARTWIVLEHPYEVFRDTPEFTGAVDQLTVTWHVVLDNDKAESKKEKSQAVRDSEKRYSYFTKTITYHNIPKGNHATSVCLHPSYYELYGEPVAVGIVMFDSAGNELEFKCSSELKSIDGIKFWEDEEQMSNLERREGLVERSKTMWGLVNPDDYELVIQ